MKRFMSGGKWGVWAGLLLLGLTESIRPGFLGLSDLAGWLTSLSILVLIGIVGSIVGGVLGPARRIPGPAWIVVVLIPAIGWGLQAFRQTDSTSARPRVVIYGIDGATWEVIDSLIEAGSLPNLARLKSGGATGTLRSESPPLSPRVWTTIATGVGPEQHGAVDFLTTQGAIRVPRIWEIVEGFGGTVGIWEWLLTWPPGQHEGFLVPGWLNRGPETWPPELGFYQRLRGEGADDLGVGGMIGAGWQGYLNGLRLQTMVKAAIYETRLRLMSTRDRRISPLRTFIHADMGADLFLFWYRRTEPRFGAFVNYAVDSLAHRFWIDFEPESFGLDEAPRGAKYAEVIPDGYRQADRILGRLMRRIDDNTLLVVVSDHGTKANEAASAHYSIRSENLIAAVDMVGRLGAFTVGRLLQLRELNAIEGEEEPEFLRLIRGATVEGAPLFEVVESTPPFYSISVAGKPNLEAMVSIAGKEIPLSRLARTSNISGDHTLDGIVGLWGPKTLAGGTIEKATLRDITPTALAFLGYPLSSMMDGGVLSAGFDPRFTRSLEPEVVSAYEFEWSQIEDQTSAEEADEEVLQRLRALGYIQ